MHASSSVGRPAQAHLEVVQRWQDAVNATDAATLTTLSSPEIEVVGPRGTVRGRAVLEEWLRRAGLSWTPVRWFTDGTGTVVVEQRAIWRDAATGEVAGNAVIASSFTVDGGLVTRFARHDDLPQALDKANLAAADETTAPRPSGPEVSSPGS